MRTGIPSSPKRPRNTARFSGRVMRWLLWLFAIVSVLILLLVACAAVAINTERGTRLLWNAATALIPDRLSGELVSGNLSDGIVLRNVAYRDDSKRVKLDQIEGAWRLSLSPLLFTVRSLHIQHAEVTLLPSPPTPAKLPQEIRLPLAIDLQRITAQRVTIHQDNQLTVYSDVSLRASSDRIQHTFDLHKAVTPYGIANASLQLNGLPPFALGGKARLTGSIREQRYRLDARLTGTLQALGIQLDAAGKNVSGRAAIDATPFAPVPLRSARIAIDRFDPNAFNANWPRAELTVNADLVPVDTATNDVSQLVVAGPVSLSNAKPGKIDTGMLPFVSAKADVRLDANQQQLSQIWIALPGNATLNGEGELRGSAQGRLTLQATQLDLHALHGKLKPTSLRGPMTARLDGDTQTFTLKLDDRDLSAAVDAELTPARISIQNAQLQAGPARLQFSGMLNRDAQAAYSAKGQLTDFNPALILASTQDANSKRRKPPRLRNINARINTDFEAQGKLHPELTAQVRFDVRDSMYDDLPMTGAGRIHLIGKRLLPSNVNLSVAGNELQLEGSFGAPSDRLQLAVDAPALDRLGFGLSGLIRIDGTVGGTLNRPTIDATYRAQQLAFGEHRLQFLSGEAHVQGVPGTTPDAQLSLDLDVRNLNSGDARIDDLRTRIDGTYASHTIDFRTNGLLRGKPLDLALAAQGRLQDTDIGMAWHGVLRTLENRQAPRVSLQSPLPVNVAPGRIEFGATRVTVAQATIDLQSFRYDAGQIRSEGVFRALDIGHLLALRQQFTGITAPFNTDLVLDGRWDFVLADAAKGFVQIDRQRGDIAITGPAGESRLGLRTLALRADLQGDRIALDARTDATRIGRMDGSGQIALQTVDGQLSLTSDATVSARFTGAIPRLQTIASLAGPRIALDGSVGIALEVTGTLNDIQLSGVVTGERLALTLYDQGVRLRDGVARIRIDNNIAELQQVEFRGGDGLLQATGRIPLDRSNSDLSATIVADRLQLLASPSAQLTVSGRATASNVNNELLVTGKFSVDRALFSLPEKAAPKLDDDVVVIRGGKPQATRPTAAARVKQPAGPYTPRINIAVDLGERFRFEGSGADLRLAGTLRIESAPDESPQAFGTLRVVDGSYEAFGTELAIERGVINFQGTIDNPNINIVAMRREQEVDAGVNVTGTAQQPRVQLISEPEVSEEEKLSWLIFGRSGGGTEAGQAQAAATGAALGLLNSFGGGRIAKRFGLDELSIGSSSFGLNDQRVVNLGKEITDRLYIGYEQSLAGAESVLKLTYELKQYWSVVLRGGAVTGLDIFYSRRFDSMRGGY